MRNLRLFVAIAAIVTAISPARAEIGMSLEAFRKACPGAKETALASIVDGTGTYSSPYAARFETKNLQLIACFEKGGLVEVTITRHDKQPLGSDTITRMLTLLGRNGQWHDLLKPGAYSYAIEGDRTVFADSDLLKKCLLISKPGFIGGYSLADAQN